MPIPTDIKFSDFIKTVKILAAKKFKYISIVNKSGSGRRIELFLEEKDPYPKEMWVVHESKYIYSDDLKKACYHLGVTVQQFKETAKSV